MSTGHCPVRYSLNDQVLNFGLLLPDLVWVSMEGPGNHFQSYRPIKDSLPVIFVVGSVLMGKELLLAKVSKNGTSGPEQKF